MGVPDRAAGRGLDGWDSMQLWDAGGEGIGAVQLSGALSE